MSDIQQKAKRRGPGVAGYIVGAVVLIGAAAALYVISPRFIKPAAPVAASAASGELKSLATGSMAALSTVSAGKPAPDTVFIDATDHPMHLADLKGKLLVVNLWATWCAPCIKEMPSLAKLQAAYPDRIVVVPISMDKTADREKARAFMAQNTPLPFYEDEKSAMAFELSPPAEGFPTTVIYDAAGHEKARLADGADWTTPEARALFDTLLKGG